ncbi:hypothetical protein ABK040_000615 [Willaertia magna]
MDGIHIQTHSDMGIQEEFYQNSYRMKPNDNEKFNKLEVEQKIEELLKSELESYEYDANTSINRSKEISAKVLDSLKKMNYPRYKFVVQTTITSSSGQGIRVASRFLWDPSTDNYATAVYKSVSIFISLFY